jgi:hypothetical protein
MKVFKFKKTKKINLSFFAQMGMDYFTTEFFIDGAKNIPPITVELRELTLVRIIDFLPRKLILADFLETVYPLVLWDKKDYDSLNPTKKQIYKKIYSMIDSKNNDFISPLFAIDPPESLSFCKNDFEKIEFSEDYSSPIFQDFFIIKPKRPVLPPLNQKYN